MEMRKSMAEARGDTRGETNNTEKEKAALPEKPTSPSTKAGDKPPIPSTRAMEKPPVPPTKAVAVAKIREAIAQAKRESCQDLAAETSNTETDHEIAATEDRGEQDHTDVVGTIVEDAQENTNKDQPSASAAAARDKLRAAIFSSARTDNQDKQCEHSTTTQTTESEAEKAERKAAVRAKIRAALLSAAAGQVEGGLQGQGRSAQGGADTRRLSTPSTNMVAGAGGGAGPMIGGGLTPAVGNKELRRRSASGIPQEGWPDPTLELGPPTRVQGLHCQDGQELDTWH